MKKSLILTMGLIVAVVSLLHGQSSIKIRITKDVNGEMETFEKTYSSEDEMKKDPEWQQFQKGKNSFVFDFRDDEEGEAFVRIEELKEGDEQKFVYAIHEGDENVNITRLDTRNTKFMEQLRDEITNGTADEELLRMIEDEIERQKESQHQVFMANTRWIEIHETNDKEFDGRGAVGKKEQLVLTDLVFSPNPTDSELKIRFTTPEKGPLSVRLFDLEGKRIFESEFESFEGTFQETIDLSGQNKGMYLLEIGNKSKRLTKKVVVK